MRRVGRSIALSCVILPTLVAGAQQRKPGLYDLTITTTTVSPSARVYPARTRQVCLTQESINRYGTFDPEIFSNLCRLTNVVTKPNGMSADIVCSSGLNGQGTLKDEWSDSEHSKGTIHFSGTVHPGQTDIKIEWTADTTATYKGPDCGQLAKPTVPPAAPPPHVTSSPTTPP